MKKFVAKCGCCNVETILEESDVLSKDEAGLAVLDLAVANEKARLESEERDYDALPWYHQLVSTNPWRDRCWRGFWLYSLEEDAKKRHYWVCALCGRKVDI